MAPVARHTAGRTPGTAPVECDISDTYTCRSLLHCRSVDDAYQMEDEAGYHQHRIPDGYE